MTNVQKVSVALTPEFMAILKDAVDTGEYTSASEVIRDALRQWKSRRIGSDFDPDEIRLLWNEGIASGRGHKTIGEIKKEGRRRISRATGKAQ